MTPAFIGRPELVPTSLPLHSTPIIQQVSVSPSPEPVIIQSPDHIEVKLSPDTNERQELDRFHLEPDRYESRHASISHSLSGAPGVSLSLPHSGSRHSLASRSMTLSQEKKEREKRKEARKAKSAQLPAHGEVQKMEHSLLKLLNEFNSGQLRAFDSAYSLEEMESVRDKQEAIARKHFELGAAQDLHPPLSDEGLAMASDNMERLMGSLEELSQAIGHLSCLDRMVDRGGRSLDMDTRDGRSSEVINFSQMDDKPLIISRRSTMSNIDNTPHRESDSDYVERVSQRTYV